MEKESTMYAQGILTLTYIVYSGRHTFSLACNRMTTSNTPQQIAKSTPLTPYTRWLGVRYSCKTHLCKCTNIEIIFISTWIVSTTTRKQYQSTLQMHTFILDGWFLSKTVATLLHLFLGYSWNQSIVMLTYGRSRKFRREKFSSITFHNEN